MFGSRLALLSFILFAVPLVLHSGSASAQPFPLLDGRGRPVDEYRTFSDPRFKACHSVECEGVRDVWDLMNMMGHRDNPNGLARLTPLPENWWDVMDRRIAHRLFAHPDRRPTYCKVVVTLARDIRSRGTDGSDVMFHALEIVGRLRSGTFDCTRPVVALLPPTEDFARVVGVIRGECVGFWHRPHCDELHVDVPVQTPKPRAD